MKKCGFTLAEILITLAIVGVVAALTAPALVKNSGQAKIGPSLSKFVNTFETACEQMMHEEEISNLKDAGDATVATGLAAKLSKYMVMTPIPDDDENYKNYKSHNPDGSGSQFISHPAYVLKNGAILHFNGNSRDLVPWLSPKGSYKGSWAYVDIDINGIAGNNNAGKEVFRFYIDDSGVLIPYGSSAHKYLDENFNKTCSTTSSNYDDGLACTGKIADNNWKADY